jgi:Lon protease-like protein
MFELPLFPLNLVLMPFQPLALHIFEERYKAMINHCISTDSPFGVVLLEQGAAEEGRSSSPPKPYLIGTSAHISQVQPLPEGRMNIIVVGRERFRIHEFRHDKPYLVGVVEYAPLLPDGESVAESSVQGLIRSVSRYLKVLEQAGRIQPASRTLPTDPSTLAFLASALLNDIDNRQRQALLEAVNLTVMMDELRVMYRREIVLLQAMLSMPEDDSGTPFSPN